MAGKARRNRGGTIRKVASGRYQVRVRDEATNRLVPLGTHLRKADADAALREALAAKDRGTWIDPDAGGETVAEYARRWIEQNPRITSPRTRERYDSVLRLHIAPVLGSLALNRVTPSMVRSWHADLAKSTSPATAAKA